MRPLLLSALALGLAAAPAAQTVETGQGTVTGLPLGARNGVFVLDADAGTLFAGPKLVVVQPDGAVRYPGDDPAFDPITAADPRVFTVDARTEGGAQTVWVGLGFSDIAADAEEPPSTAAGFAVSTDGGVTWRGTAAPLDESRDTQVTVGASTLVAVPTTAPQGAPPLDLAIAAGDTVYSANGAAGLRRTTDGGQSWRRIVLPPDSLTVLDPRRPQTFVYAAQGEFLPGTEDRSREALNFFAYSVLVTADSTVWAGTFSGLNRSVRLDGQSDLAWVRYLDSPFGNAPVGNHIYALEARPRDDGRDEVWAACWVSPDERSAPDEEFGVVAWTGDDAEGRPVFSTKLLGVRVYDLAFDGQRAYAASTEGLHIADDADQDVWRVVRVFRGPDGAPLSIPEGTGVFAVAVTDGIVWAGTPEGLLRSADGGTSWSIFRASVPTQPDGVASDDVPRVDVYAYPNPFTPRTDGSARIRFDLDGGADVTVRVFDFGMRIVRTLDAAGRPAGANEVLWDGRTDGGTRVANGAYIYVVDAGGEQLSGKILVFE